MVEKYLDHQHGQKRDFEGVLKLSAKEDLNGL